MPHAPRPNHGDPKLVNVITAALAAVLGEDPNPEADRFVPANTRARRRAAERAAARENRRPRQLHPLAARPPIPTEAEQEVEARLHAAYEKAHADKVPWVFPEDEDARRRARAAGRRARRARAITRRRAA